MSCLTLLGPAGAPTRLVCLPHAGASGDVYAAWSGDLAGALEVWGATPAGRRHRSGEPLNVDPGRLVDEVVAEVTTDSRPLVVFGHSMGALIGYELSLALSTQGRPPTALVVSGCPPPHVRTARASRDYSDDELAATLAGELDLGEAAAWHKVIREKRATFSARPGIRRPACRTSHPRIFLAGDYTWDDYPATLEGAVRSGRRAARQAMEIAPAA